MFTESRSKTDEELREIIGFYDYVEVQPVDVYSHLIYTGDFSGEPEIINHIKNAE